MTKLDNATARALVDAGYMPPEAYFRMFGEQAADQVRAVPGVENGSSPPSSQPANTSVVLPARFASMRSTNYRLICRTRLGSGVRLVPARGPGFVGDLPRQH